MAKVLDITEKLSFEGNPRLKIKGRELEVNADAPTMLKDVYKRQAESWAGEPDAYRI